MISGNTYIDKFGNRFPILTVNGQIYLADPEYKINTSHKMVPATQAPITQASPSALVNSPMPAPAVKTLAGFLGTTTTDTAVQAAAQAANFIPGVGPIVSSVLQIGDAIFGGGDPTPLSQLISNIVNLRAQIAANNNAMGVADSFVVPSDFNPQDKGKAHPGFVDGIVEQALGVSEAQIQSSRRKDYYSAITALQQQLQQVKQQANNVALTAQVTQQVEQQLGAPLQAPISSVGSPVSSLLDTSGSVASPGSLVTMPGTVVAPTSSINPLYAIGALASVLLAILAFS